MFLAHQSIVFRSAVSSLLVAGSIVLAADPAVRIGSDAGPSTARAHTVGAFTSEHASRSLPVPPCSSHSADTSPLPGPPTETFQVPDSPFGIVSVAGGRYVVVSLHDQSLVLMQEHGSALRLVRAVTLPGDQGAYGIALSHNGEYLAVTENSGTALLSTARLIEGRGNPVLGVFTDGMSGTIETAFSADDAYLFVSDEVSAAVSVFNVSRALHHGFSAPGVNIGQVPVSFETVGMALSPDGHTLYATSEFTGQPGREGFSTQTGQLQAIAVRKAEQNPGEALVASVPAGCEPVRVVLSQNGGLAWVSARGSNALLAFDTRRLDSHPSPTLVADVPVGQEPVGLTFVDGGRFLLVAESARFASPQAAQTVGVVNVEAALSAENALVGSIPAGEFPRELAVDRQSHQVLLTNFDSDTVEIFSADVERFVPKSKGG